MSKKEYLNRLEVLLSGISKEERQAAMEYYADYLEEAGTEGESDAMERLGSPEKVADSILKGMRNEGSEGNWTEMGFEEIPPQREVPDSREQMQKRECRKKGIFWLLVVMAGFIICGIQVFTTIVSIAFSVIVAVAAVCFGGIAVVLALMLAGIVLLVIGIVKLISVPGMGAMLAGAGFLCLAIAFLILPVAIWLLRSAVPGIWKGVTRIFHRMFGGGRNNA